MKASDYQAYRDAIGALALSFGKEASVALYDAYELGLGDLPIESIQAAVAKAIRECEHFPRPVELRRLAGEQTSQAKAIAAWGDVQRSWSLGSYKHVDFADGLINATIRSLGGWPAMFEQTGSVDDEKWYRLNFLKTYEQLANGRVDGDACRPLVGLSVKTVINGQIADPVPVRIGCSEDRLMITHRATNNSMIEA